MWLPEELFVYSRISNNGNNAANSKNKGYGN